MSYSWCLHLVDRYSIMEHMKETITIVFSTLLGYALWLLLAIVTITGVVTAQTPTHAIQAKDGASCAIMFDDAIATNIRPECVRTLAPIVAAIRYAENGKTYQYGIIHKRCPKGYRPQAGWCAATVQKNHDRWIKAGSKGEFITYLGGIYCPIGADNDPTGLNKHWIKNVKKFNKRFAYTS